MKAGIWNCLYIPFKTFESMFLKVAAVNKLCKYWLVSLTYSIAFAVIPELQYWLHMVKKESRLTGCAERIKEIKKML